MIAICLGPGETPAEQTGQAVVEGANLNGAGLGTTVRCHASKIISMVVAWDVFSFAIRGLDFRPNMSHDHT